MLLEQAFFHLPEILHGSGYQLQEYESGIVGAYTMALLQTLNGRNIANPISCLQNEKRYRDRGKYKYIPNPRHLRADLYINLSSLKTATKRLSQYGWRHHNWLEAKFLRGQAGQANRHCTNKTNYVAGHLADLIRLVTLVPESSNPLSSSGRYFLHTYDAPPKYYLTSTTRDWCNLISKAGTHQLSISGLDNEVPRIRDLIGLFPDFSTEIQVTNFLASPSDTSHLPCYWCILTRIDEVTINCVGNSISFQTNREVKSSSNDSIDRIAQYVIERLHIPSKSPEATEPAELDSDESDLTSGAGE